MTITYHYKKFDLYWLSIKICIERMISMNILIYDDNESDIQHLVECIDSFFKNNNIKYQIQVCQNSDELFKTIKNYDLLFLDIKINNDNGIDIGLKLKKCRHDCRIIITTNYAKYAIDGYKIHADRYFIKPINQQEFNMEMNTIIKRYFKNSIGFYDKKISRAKIYIKDIVYIEFIDRKSLIHKLNGETITTNRTLKYWYDKLQQYGFAYPYKAFIVNLEYVNSIKKDEITMINEDKIPLSRFYKKEFENKYEDYLHYIL